jgi:hypothetical protein
MDRISFICSFGLLGIKPDREDYTDYNSKNLNINAKITAYNTNKVGLKGEGAIKSEIVFDDGFKFVSYKCSTEKQFNTTYYYLPDSTKFSIISKALAEHANAMKLAGTSGVRDDYPFGLKKGLLELVPKQNTNYKRVWKIIEKTAKQLNDYALNNKNLFIDAENTIDYSENGDNSNLFLKLAGIYCAILKVAFGMRTKAETIVSDIRTNLPSSISQLPNFHYNLLNSYIETNKSFMLQQLLTTADLEQILDN